jgi:carboxymethylenebutenolidase
MTDLMVNLDRSTMAYEARPDSLEPAPGVLVIHEVTGLVDYIKEVCGTIAKHGFVALAPDLYEGKTASGMEDGAPLRDKVTDDVFKATIGAGVRYLKSKPYCSGKLGVVGFCMGGGFSLRVACQFPQDIDACSIFYGRIPDMQLVNDLRCPVIGNFGGEDKGITTWAIEQLKPAMARLGKSLDMKVYPGAPHGFHRHTAPAVYRPEAAEDAFQRTMDFFGRELKQRALDPVER